METMRPIALALLSACGFAPTVASSNGSDSPVDAQAPMVVIDVRPIDAPPVVPKTWQVIDTITVPCLNQSVTSTAVLASTGTYHVRASGECIANTQNNSKADAEYLGYNVGPTYDVYSNVDNGLAVNDLALGATKNPRWGAYTSTHMYEQPWTGADATIGISFHSNDESNNSGSLKVEILSYQ